MAQTQINPNQIKESGAVAGQALIFNGTAWVPTSIPASPTPYELMRQTQFLL
jgi:hypothetical protein